jgi:hypothetical protein
MSPIRFERAFIVVVLCSGTAIKVLCCNYFDPAEANSSYTATAVLRWTLMAKDSGSGNNEPPAK